ncbi:hypothetical protein SAMN04487941_2546 [Pontibacter akesuensis]|uniref:Uncharacterized protein n=1 Tax=Pontibacter akesuensis TaxID=388950 RepID=A0A1I7J6Q6_9BACT|nr:hypothetical protein SAMN04487941_2546 [Pontibacter akesuensis]
MFQLLLYSSLHKSRLMYLKNFHDRLLCGMIFFQNRYQFISYHSFKIFIFLLPREMIYNPGAKSLNEIIPVLLNGP